MLGSNHKMLLRNPAYNNRWWQSYSICQSAPVWSQLWMLVLISRAEFHFVRRRLKFSIASSSFSPPLGFSCCPGSLSGFIHPCLVLLHTTWAQQDLVWQNQIHLKKAGQAPTGLESLGGSKSLSWAHSHSRIMCTNCHAFLHWLTKSWY